MRSNVLALSTMAVVGISTMALGFAGSSARAKGHPKSGEPDSSEARAPSSPEARPASNPGAVVDQQRIVQATATEVDAAEDIVFSPETDPACASRGEFIDSMKEGGYEVDKLIRSGRAVTDEEEQELGRQTLGEMRRMRKLSRRIDTADMERDRAYVAAVAAPLVALVERKGIAFTFHTIDDDEANAFAIPGGDVFVYRGLLEQPGRIENEAQLAGVLAHEINHVDRRHTIAEFEYLKQLRGGADAAGDLAETAVALARHPFASSQEDEADEYAVRFLIAAEYSPKQFVIAWQNWARLDGERPGEGSLFGALEGVFDSHPPPEKRACHAMRVTMEAKDPSTPRYYVGTTNFRERRARSTIQH